MGRYSNNWNFIQIYDLNFIKLYSLHHSLKLYNTVHLLLKGLHAFICIKTLSIKTIPIFVI
jgi:hypothetical protein